MNAKILIGIFLVGLIILSGCTGKPTYSDSGSNTPTNKAVNTNTTPVEPVVEAKPVIKEVTTLDVWLAKMDNWDADPEADGIEIQIQPRDSNDKPQYVAGVANARAYTRNLNTSTFKYEKDELVKEWTNIQIDSDYDILGKKVRLEFDGGYVPDSGLYLEFDFIYNGKTYSVVEESVLDFS
jgi:hypothetical protein